MLSRLVAFTLALTLGSSGAATLAAQEPQPKDRPAPAPNADFDKGLALFLGEGGKRDLTAALKHFQAAADKGHSPARFYLAVYHLDGFNCVPVDRRAAITCLQQSSEDYAPARAVLGLAYIQPWTGVTKNEHRGLALIDKSVDDVKASAAKGDLTARMVLAELYNAGRGVAVDTKEATRLMTQGAKEGYLPAKMALARSAYLVDKNYDQSLPAFRELAELGHATAQTFLAGHYRNGRGTPVSDAQYRKWLETAAAQNETAAVWLLRGEVCDLICKRHNEADKNQTAAELDLEDRVVELARIRDRLYADLFADNRLRRPAVEKTIPFDDDEIVTRNDAVVEMMEGVRVISATYTRALASSLPLVRGAGNQAGYLTGMEQVYDISIDLLRTAWKAQMSAGVRVWKDLSEDEKAAALKYQGRFAREVSGANEKELARLAEKIKAAPGDSTLYLARARLHEERFDFPRMLADLNAVVEQKDKNSAYARYLRACHYEVYGLVHKAEYEFKQIRPGDAKSDPRIDSERVSRYPR